METNYKNNSKANRILYLIVVAVLCATALIIGLVAAFNRPHKATPGIGTTASPSTTAPSVPDDDTDTPRPLPRFTAPATGAVAKEHDPATLVFSSTMNDFRTHTGIDIATAIGAGVYAAADGTVSEIWQDPLMGTCVAITHEGDTVSIYKNLAVTLAEGITVGSTVEGGQLIASVGETALIEICDEPHLHFEMTQGGLAVDPLSFISEESKEASLSRDEAFEG